MSDEELYSTTGKKGALVGAIDEEVQMVFGGMIDIDVQVDDSGSKFHYISFDGKSWVAMTD
jgi:hypothetical protein